MMEAKIVISTNMLMDKTVVQGFNEIVENEFNNNNNNNINEVIVTVEKNVYKKIYHQLGRLKWSNIIILVAMHTLSLVGFIHIIAHDVKLYTFIFSSILGLASGLGMAVGGHRLWAHRSFKATATLRLILAILQVMTMNGSAFSYARDHRTHHKYSDTDQDPKNPSRGLFYSHIGWWMVRKSDRVKQAGSKLNFDDLKADRICWLQHRFYMPLFVVFGVMIPTLIPYYAWNETILTSFYLCAILRTTVVLHHLFMVNSIAHFFGHRPYDFRIRPTENRLVIYLSLGEGNHNYHHTFPYDYSSSEKAAWEFFNPSTMIIDFFWLFGMAYDLKKASRQVIDGTVNRKGVPTYFDPPKSLCFRIVNGIFDWIIGLIFALWPLIPMIGFKLILNKSVFIL